MNNLNYKILGMAVATFCMVMTRPDIGMYTLDPTAVNLLPIFYISLCAWIYFTVKVAIHDPYE